MAKSYNDYYKDYVKGVNTSAYDKLASDYAKSVDADKTEQIKQANTAATGQLRQAYVSRVQDQQALNNRLTDAGIRGGATETSNLKLATNYANTRSGINASRAQAITDINRTAQQNKLAYRQDIDAKKQAYIENRQAEARQAAREAVTNDTNRAIQREQTVYERKRAENQTAYERQQTKRTQEIERLTATMSKYYDVDKLKKLLENPNYKNNPLAVQVINARIGYLGTPEYKQAAKAAK